MEVKVTLSVLTLVKFTEHYELYTVVILSFHTYGAESC